MPQDSVGACDFRVVRNTCSLDLVQVDVCIYNSAYSLRRLRKLGDGHKPRQGVSYDTCLCASHVSVWCLAQHPRRQGSGRKLDLDGVLRVGLFLRRGGESLSVCVRVDNFVSRRASVSYLVWLFTAAKHPRLECDRYVVGCLPKGRHGYRKLAQVHSQPQVADNRSLQGATLQ